MRTPFCDDLAVTQHNNSIADRGNHVHVVLDDEDANVAPLAGIQDETRDVFPFLLVHAGHRLVEDEKPRLRGERARKLHALLQPHRNHLDRLVTNVLELQEFDDFFDDLPVCQFLSQSPDPIEQARQSARPHVDVTAKHDVVENAHSPKQGQVLKGTSNAATCDSVRRQTGDVLAEQGHASGVRWIKAGHDIDHGGLAASIRTDHGEYFTTMDVEGHAFERLQATEWTLDAGASEHRVVRVGRDVIDHRNESSTLHSEHAIVWSSNRSVKS